MSKFSELSFYIMTSLHTKFELPANFSSISLNFTSYLINYSWNWRQNGSKFSELSFYIIMSLYTKFGLPANFSSIFLNFTSYLINYSRKWRHHESCHQKKCVCHDPYTIEMTLRQKLAKKILCWKIARCIHLSAPLLENGVPTLKK